MPNFLVEETTVRECGESSVLDLGENQTCDFMLTLEVTHVKQHQDLDVHIFASYDGVNWLPRPVASFLEKIHCGTYKIVLPAAAARYLRAVWQVNGWSRTNSHPLFRFCLAVEQVRTRTMAGAA
ncbi:MAG: hypothetical protein ABUS51_06330 [Acidobacteriota bacterium]